MKRPDLLPFYLLILLATLFFTVNPALANGLGHIKSPNLPLSPVIEPKPPHLAAKAYIIIDSNSGKIIAEKNSEKKLPPASLTKMMTLYVISSALKNEQIHLTDKVKISKKAWKTGGSRMFVKEGQSVTIENLLKGIIVDSGNDACVAMAEHLAGSEKSFAVLMNQQAKSLGMNNSHFTDSTGLPDKNHYTTAHDLALLGRALVQDFPAYYHWYKQKWFTFNGIRQPNRNRLLWRDRHVDGLKTGHTKEAGYCLVASSMRDDMRLISVTLGAPNDASRAQGSQHLLNFGFRFYETHKLYSAQSKISSLTAWKGTKKTIDAGLESPLYITIPSGQYKQLNIRLTTENMLEAPIKKGQRIGTLRISLLDKVILERELIALDNLAKGGVLSRMGDSVSMTFHQWFSHEQRAA